MSGSPVGKPSPDRLHRLIRDRLGAPAPELIVGPGPGLDAAVLDLGDGRVMAIAEDPIFPAPGLPFEMFGWFTVHIGASDVAVTGIPPRYLTYTLLLPRSTSETDAGVIVDAVSSAAADLGISIVGGHTGWYDAVTVPTVGGVAVWGFAPADQWISPGGARDGDLLLMTKGPSIEAAALLAVLYRDRLANRIRPDDLRTALNRAGEISVVADSAAAFAAGGVHAMHDATEGGVLGGLWEMQAAAGIPVVADIDRVPVPDDIAAVADALGFDPWRAISEGTLLAAVDPDAADNVLAGWRDAGIPAWSLGRFAAAASAGSVMRDGNRLPLEEPVEDPFWDLFFAGIRDAGDAS